MQLIIITGFLGSGKTTLLLEVAKELSQHGKKIAIIENEVGKIGIDDCLIKENGFNVREIYSGCICCSLRMDLISTLMTLEREYDPDIVILEPSGVAGPKQVLSALQGYGGEIDKKTVINIIDVSRFYKLEKLTLPIITDGIETAGILVLNKTDLIAEDDLEELRERLKEFNESAPMISISLLKDKNIDSLLSEICSRSEDDNTDTIIDAQHSKNMPEPAVYSMEEQIIIKPEQTPQNLIDDWIDSLGSVAGMLEEAEAVIGHIKVMLNAGKNGYCVISLTSPDHPPVVKGKLKDNSEEIRLRINAIAYNISNEKLMKVMGN